VVAAAAAVLPVADTADLAESEMWYVWSTDLTASTPAKILSVSPIFRSIQQLWLQRWQRLDVIHLRIWPC